MECNHGRCAIASRDNKREKSSPDLEAIYERFHDRLRAFVRGRVSDAAAADDILQDVFLKVHSRIGTLEDESKVESWIYQVTRNAVVDYYRNRQISDPLNEGMHPTEDLLDVDLAERIAPAVREFVGQLPEPYREALVLTEYEGLSQQELAERAGISLPGAKSRVQRARAMLKKLLQQCCHFEFDRYGTLMDYHEISCSCCKDQASGA